MLFFRVSGQELSGNAGVIAEKSKNYLSARFIFSEDWKDFTDRWAHFSKGGTVYDVRVVDGKITPESHLSLDEGQWILYLHGSKYDENGNLEKRITTDCVRFEVEPCGPLFGIEPEDVPPTAIEQIEGGVRRTEESLADMQSTLENWTSFEEYSPDAAYKVGNKVTSLGSLFICVRNAPAGTPVSDTRYFRTAAAKGDKGEKGDKGDKGDSGAPGARGARGRSVLSAALGTPSDIPLGGVYYLSAARAASFGLLIAEGDHVIDTVNFRLFECGGTCELENGEQYLLNCIGRISGDKGDKGDDGESFTPDFLRYPLGFTDCPEVGSVYTEGDPERLRAFSDSCCESYGREPRVGDLVYDSVGGGMYVIFSSFNGEAETMELCQKFLCISSRVGNTPGIIGGARAVSMSMAEYESIEPDANTFYFVYEE